MCASKQPSTTVTPVLVGLSANRNVWSAAFPQAKNESNGLVCANVFGLCWSVGSGPGWNALRSVVH